MMIAGGIDVDDDVMLCNRGVNDTLLTPSIWPTDSILIGTAGGQSNRG
jgi:hypothetical protein